MLLEYYIMGVILIPGLLIALYAQMKINNTYAMYNSVVCEKGLTAAEVARIILDSAGLTNIKIVKIRGHLTDNYNHSTKTISLSSSVHDSKSVAAIGVAAHECGHAIQYKNHYLPIKIRNFLIPITNFVSVLLWPLVIIGLVLNFAVVSSGIVGDVFLWIGVGTFGLSVLLSLITLPVEYNASRRAKDILLKSGILNEKETQGAAKVLSAAALTYVASLIVSILSLFRFLFTVLMFRRD